MKVCAISKSHPQDPNENTHTHTHTDPCLKEEPPTSAANTRVNIFRVLLYAKCPCREIQFSGGAASSQFSTESRKCWPRLSQTEGVSILTMQGARRTKWQGLCQPIKFSSFSFCFVPLVFFLNCSYSAQWPVQCTSINLKCCHSLHTLRCRGNGTLWRGNATSGTYRQLWMSPDGSQNCRNQRVKGK